MRSCLLAALPLTLLALAVPAGAHAASYKATIAPLAASAGGPSGGAATTARHKGKRGAAGVRGKARLTDRAGRDKLRISLRGLPRGARYGWSLRAAAAGGDPCAGEVVGAFTYRALRRGRPGARARARDFAVVPGTAYAVVVTAAAGQDLACGVFRGTPAASDDGSVQDEDEALEDEPFDDGSSEFEDEPLGEADLPLEDDGDPVDDLGGDEDF